MINSVPSNVDNFSLAESRHIIRDLFEPKPLVYWGDFLLTIMVGHVGFSIVRLLPMLMPDPLWIRVSLQSVVFVIYCLAFYRAAMFIHELVHLRTGTFRVFRIMWNLLCGIPFLMPSFVYYPHLDHHRRKNFGTSHDGEYLPLGQQPPWHILYYLSQSLIIPLLAVVRFLVLTPLSWFSPRLRRFIHQRASSMVIDPTYLRPQPTPEALRIIRLQEVLCFLWCAGVFGVIATFGKWPFPLLTQMYLTSVFIITLNAVRTLGAHRYFSDGHEMTFIDQLLDSVNYHRRPWTTELWAPLTRYHALHHLFPSLPYHAMPEAHRRLREQLPPDSVYHQTEEESLGSALLDLWQRARQSRGAEQAEVPAQTVA
jgi:fatty acid desaturase